MSALTLCLFPPNSGDISVWLLLSVIALIPMVMAILTKAGIAKSTGDISSGGEILVESSFSRYGPVSIALVAGIALFAELLVIRMHASFFQLLAYAKNLSLLSCFLGLGVGYLRPKNSPVRPTTPVLMIALQIVFLYALRRALPGEVFQNPIPDQLTFGLSTAESLPKVLLSFGFIAFLFWYNSMCFVPLGQLIAMLMEREERLRAYGWNLCGSMAGIGAFFIASWFWTPPEVWFLLFGLAMLLVFDLNPSGRALIVGAVAVVGTILALPTIYHGVDLYSPYQILSLRLSPHDAPHILTSNTYYQAVLDLSDSGADSSDDQQVRRSYYKLPYLFVEEPENVLVLGSGSGNDVAAALRFTNAKIDAVEIDPAIVDFGRILHRELPYYSDRVNVHVTDARAFLRSSEDLYDLIVFGLLDSHTLLTSVSGGIRLDSYVYTVESFRQARARLKPGGLLSITFAELRKELSQKMYNMLVEAFDGRLPKVYSVDYDRGMTFIVGESEAPTPMEESLRIKEISQDFVERKLLVDSSTDNWPFFYMPQKKYSPSYLALLGVLLALSFLFMRAAGGYSESGISPTCFFLGAGFMLVETKGITELALVFGSTWIVTCVVIAGALTMAFIANLYVINKGAPKIWLSYACLIVTLGVGYAWTLGWYEFLSGWMYAISAVVILTAPLFFSGLAFSAELTRVKNISIALSSNIFGAMLGGMLEANAMAHGYRSLYLWAAVMYISAYIFAKREA